MLHDAGKKKTLKKKKQEDACSEHRGVVEVADLDSDTAALEYMRSFRRVKPMWK